MYEIKYRDESEMKDTNIEWFGHISKDWKITKVKRIFNIGRGRVISQTELSDNYTFPVYSSQTKDDGVLGFIDTYDFDSTQLTWTTDGANAGTVFIRKGKYNCTNVCGTLRLRGNENSIMYFKYLLEYTAIFHKRADTNGYKIMNNEMAEITIIFPSYKEQEKIANFLDIKTNHFDGIIAKKEQLIEKLEQAKKSLISEVVTGKVKIVDGKLVHREESEMKDSGVEWIDTMPKSWILNKLKNVLKINPPKSEVINRQESCSFIPMEKVFNDYIETDQINIIKDVYSGYTYFRDGDIVMAKVTPCFENGKIAIANNLENGIAFGSTELNVFRPQSIHRRYLFYIMQEDHFVKYGSYNMTGVGGLKRVPSEHFLNYKFYEPSIEEQEKLSHYLDIKIKVMVSIKEQNQIEINLIKEAKQSLISETVTGKIDLRDWEIIEGGDLH